MADREPARTKLKSWLPGRKGQGGEGLSHGLGGSAGSGTGPSGPQDETSDMKTREDLGPTGPAKLPGGPKDSYEKKHPNPGNIQSGQHIGPHPTDDPRGKSKDLKDVIDKKRAGTPAD